MDTITQGILGAATAQLGFRQRIGGDATWAAAVAGVVPDLDVFVAPLLELTGAEVGGLAHLRYHRGLSHSLLFAPVLSLLITLAWWRIRRWALSTPATAEDPKQKRPRFTSFGWLYGCVLVAVVTHPLLDWCTSYGTRLWMPLTNHRYTIDAAPIVDIIYTPLLVLTLLACYLVRKALTVDRARRVTLVIGWAGMLLSVGYLATGRIMHDWAVRKALAVTPEGRVVTADAYPMIGTIFLWRTVVQTDEAWIVARIHHFDDTPPEHIPRQRVEKQPRTEWVDRAMNLPEMDTWQWFTNNRMRVETHRENGRQLVEFHDMRYGARSDSIESLWWLTIAFDDNGRVERIARDSAYRSDDTRRLVARLWSDIWNP